VDLAEVSLMKIANELTKSRRQNITVNWTSRESVRAKL
jgi:hypothetical protein